MVGRRNTVPTVWYDGHCVYLLRDWILRLLCSNGRIHLKCDWIKCSPDLEKKKRLHGQTFVTLGFDQGLSTWKLLG